jgi:F-type H+-transporting ATPase subunit a
MHEIPRQVLIKLPPLWGVDLSITNEVILLWIAAALTFVLVTVACRRRSEIAKGPFQNLFEAIIEFLDDAIGHDILGEHGRHWAPFLLTLFFLILFTNLLGLAPLPSHVKAMTSSINVTAAFAIIVFVTTIVVNIRTHGLFGFLKKFSPSGLPLVVKVLAVPIEVISWLARPLSLAIRLCANMMAGHALILIFLGMAGSAMWLLKPLPYAGAIIMSAFELFVSFVQAFIFTLLAGMYIKDALDAH